MHDLHDALARANFRVVVVVPDQVDYVDLSRPDDPRRWLYTYVGPDGGDARGAGDVVAGWERCEMWP